MDYLSYNGPSNNNGGSSKLILFTALMLIFFIAMPFFMPRPQEDPSKADASQETSKDATASPNIAVRYPKATRTLETPQLSVTMTNAGGGRASEILVKDPDRYLKHGDFLRSQKPENPDQPGFLPFEVSLPSFHVSPQTQFEAISSPDRHDSAQFSYQSPDGKLKFVKTFSTTDTPYILHAKFELTNLTSQEISDTLAISLHIKQIEGEEPGLFTPGSYVAAKCFYDDDLEYLDATDTDESETYTVKNDKNIQWFAIDESYFAIAISAQNAESCVIKNDDKRLSSTLNTPVRIAPNASSTLEFDIYMGPKESRYLQNFGDERKLTEIIDYGWIEVLARPMAFILDIFHQWTGNWGLAIIILTLIVRALLWPIAQKSQISMMRMSKLAPLMQELQEKYKDDPATLQQKQLELYQQHQVNPFGCLPLLLQMPIFFALYRCIFVTGGLYQASFVLWIQDLSAPDPYFVLPILSVALLVVQQLLTPTATKNKQQKIMMFAMPAIFGLMMLFLPSGLCLYMVVSSTFSMGQSFYVRRIIAAEDAAKDAPEVEVIEGRNSRERRTAKRHKD